jgi:hypothetical protein
MPSASKNTIPSNNYRCTAISAISRTSPPSALPKSSDQCTTIIK